MESKYPLKKGMSKKLNDDSSERGTSPSCYQRGGKVRGKKRVVRPAKKGNVQIVTVNVTRPVRARGHAPRPTATTVQSFVQQPTAIQQPYSLASASGPYQSFGEANYQQRLGEYFKSMSEPNKQQNFNEIEPIRQRQPVMAEFGSQTAPIQLSKEEIARKRLERFNYGIRMPVDFGSQTEPIKFGDFGSQTEPNKFSNFGTQTDVDKNLSFAEMEKERKRLKLEPKEVPADIPMEVPEEVPVEQPVEKPVEPPVEEEKKEEVPALHLKSAVLYDIKTIQSFQAGTKGVKDAINAILAKYNIVVRGKDIPALKEKAIRRLLALDVIDTSSKLQL